MGNDRWTKKNRRGGTWLFPTKEEKEVTTRKKDFNRREKFYIHEIKTGYLTLAEVNKEDRTRNVCIAAVQKNGMDLQFVPEKLKTEDKIVSDALNNNANALQFAAQTTKENFEYVQIAVKQKPEAVQFVLPELTKERGKLLYLVNYNPKTFQYLPEEMKNDQEVVEKAIVIEPDNLQFASNRIKQSKPILEYLMSKNLNVLKYASVDLMKDKKLRDLFLRQYPTEGAAILDALIAEQTGEYVAPLITVTAEADSNDEPDAFGEPNNPAFNDGGQEESKLDGPLQNGFLQTSFNAAEPNLRTVPDASNPLAGTAVDARNRFGESNNGSQWFSQERQIWLGARKAELHGDITSINKLNQNPSAQSESIQLTLNDLQTDQHPTKFVFTCGLHSCNLQSSIFSKGHKPSIPFSQVKSIKDDKLTVNFEREVSVVDVHISSDVTTWQTAVFLYGRFAQRINLIISPFLGVKWRYPPSFVQQLEAFNLFLSKFSYGPDKLNCVQIQLILLDLPLYASSELAQQFVLANFYFLEKKWFSRVGALDFAFPAKFHHSYKNGINRFIDTIKTTQLGRNTMLAVTHDEVIDQFVRLIHPPFRGTKQSLWSFSNIQGEWKAYQGILFSTQNLSLDNFCNPKINYAKVIKSHLTQYEDPFEVLSQPNLTNPDQNPYFAPLLEVDDGEEHKADELTASIRQPSKKASLEEMNPTGLGGNNRKKTITKRFLNMRIRATRSKNKN